MTKNVDKWSECNKFLISSRYEIVLEREICLGVPISRFWCLFEATNQTHGTMKPPNLWNHETFETTKPMQTRNPWNHKNTETFETTKPMKRMKSRNPFNYEKHVTRHPTVSTLNLLQYAIKPWIHSRFALRSQSISIFF